jgi:hypothetical protein
MNNDDQIVSILMDIREDIGELKATVNGLESMHHRVLSLELTRAHSKGASRVWHMVTAAAGGVIGFVASYFSGHH